MNFVYTDLTQATAFTYLTDTRDNGYGPAFAQAAASATVQPITAAGVELSPDFLNRIRNQGQGVILIEARQASTKPLVLTVETGTGTAIVSLPLQALGASLAVDANRDGAIKLASEDASDATSADQPFRFWLNDDDDEHAPGPPQRADYATAHVDGAKDLEDFFPVILDLQQLVKALPPSSSVKYKLKQADGAVNLVETNLTQTTAFAYRTTTFSTGFGATLAEPAASATTTRVTAAGVELSAQFLNNVRDNNQGVILVEGRTPSTAPLVLTVENNGAQVAEVSLPLSLGARIVLLLHGMNSNTKTWDALVTANFGDPNTTGAADIRDRVIQSTTAPVMTANGVRCYRLQFGFYDVGSTLKGVEDVTAANTPDYLTGRITRCGDFETFAQLGQEVDDAIDALLDPNAHPENKYAQIILVGHSRGGLSARAFLQGSFPNRSAVVGLLTTGSPHLGSPMGRIYDWLATHKRGAVGTSLDDWQVVDKLIANGLDVRRPVIGDLASYAGTPALSPALTTLNAAVASLPANIRYGEIAYHKAKLGFLARVTVAGVVINYTVFDEAGTNAGEQLSTAAQSEILGVGKTSADYPGDGLIPGPRQVYTQLSGFGGIKIARLTNTTDEVLHTEEPDRIANVRSQLHVLAPDWFPQATP